MTEEEKRKAKMEAEAVYEAATAQALDAYYAATTHVHTVYSSGAPADVAAYIAVEKQAFTTYKEATAPARAAYAARIREIEAS